MQHPQSPSLTYQGYACRALLVVAFIVLASLSACTTGATPSTNTTSTPTPTSTPSVIGSWFLTVLSEGNSHTVKEFATFTSGAGLIITTQTEIGQESREQTGHGTWKLTQAGSLEANSFMFAMQENLVMLKQVRFKGQLDAIGNALQGTVQMMTFDLNGHQVNMLAGMFQAQRICLGDIGFPEVRVQASEAFTALLTRPLVQSC